MMTWNDVLENVKTVCIVGHVKPDGDCIGSCLGLRNYLADCYPQIQVDVYLDAYEDKFSYMRYENVVRHEEVADMQYDLFIALDCAELHRIGVGQSYFATAKKTLNIDHHISNPNYADCNYVVPHASAAAEVLYHLFEKEKISKETAECLYTAIAHDTGIFKYSSVTGNTMRAVAELIDKGVDFSWILNHTILEKEYEQNRFSGYCVYHSKQILNGICIWSAVTKKEMEEIGVTEHATRGIAERLRDVKGADCSFFMHEKEPGMYRISMRSKEFIDVNQICSQFGGGGHIRAAGCNIFGTQEEIVEQITSEIKKQL